MPPAGFEHTIPTRERPQTPTLDRVATGTGKIMMVVVFLWSFPPEHGHQASAQRSTDL